MTLPVSKYEELLETVRSLKQQTIRVRELVSPLLDTIITANTTAPAGVLSLDDVDLTKEDCVDWFEVEDNKNFRPRSLSPENVLSDYSKNRSTSPMELESLVVERKYKTSTPKQLQIYDDSMEFSREKRTGTHMSVSSEPESGISERDVSMLYRGTWPVERGMWTSEPPNFNHCNVNSQTDAASVMSFASSSGAAPLDKVLNGTDTSRASSQQQLEVKVDMVYSLLSMLGTQECPDMGETLLALSSSPESSLAMRQAGCLSVLVQLVYSDKDKDTREKASKALCNLVQVQPDEKIKRRELKVLKLLEEIRTYCIKVLEMKEKGELDKNFADNHPSQITENIIKLSFDEGYRQTICELGGIYALANLVEVDHKMHTGNLENDQCVLLRRYSGMALTNLTFGHSQNKSLLCSFRDFMKCLVAQLTSTSDELRQVTAAVLRNLSWRADNSSRLILREVGSVPALMSAAIISHKESTLKAILSALWNLSAHCSMNKADICSVDGALGFLVDMFNYKPPSKTLIIIENAGGILRNISSHIAVRDDYRAILRKHNCLQILLQQLKSPSLTIVSNACGTLWNLSAKCAEDQKMLWDLGAAPMLRSLNHSKHIMIATGSRAALKNLLSSRSAQSLFNHMDSTTKELGLPALPTLGARKQRALDKDLDQNLAETCDNIEPTSPLCATKSTPQLQRKFNYAVKQDAGINEEQVIQSFNSLTLSDTRLEVSAKSEVYQQNSSGSNSLPYPTNSSRGNRSTTFIPVRNKFLDCSFEDNNVEEPVNYSQKYSETKNYSSSTKPVEPELESNTYSVKCQKGSVAYSDYAETDLDQPTNYSLRYPENDSDPEDECRKSTVMHSERFYVEQQDTVKTYCTEGTPYETPLNFSTATSMSDLRLDANTDDKNQPKNKLPETANKQEVLQPDLDESFEHPAESNHVNTPEKKLKSEFSSGLMSPEKPVNYCLEESPHSFSCVSSFSSLNLEEPSVEAKVVKNEENKKVIQEKILEDQNNVAYVEERKKQEEENVDEVKSENKLDKEESGAVGKVVTFGNVVDYAEETPLMFSRSSSLGSLSSTEQHSIHDDRSSVISDFSRLTSGIISPSELPDSPTQTVPPSPRQQKPPVEFPTVSNSVQQKQEKSVFEDSVNKYKEVNTPVEFSTNTSLSSLTIDDEPNVTAFNLLENTIMKRQNVSETSVESDLNNTSATDMKNKEEMLPTCEEDEEMLAACINKGIKNNRYRKEQQQSSKTECVENVVENSADVMSRESEEKREEDLLAKCIKSGIQNNRYRQNKLDSDGKSSISTDTTCLQLPICKTEEETEEELLAACINSGIQNNRYRHNKFENGSNDAGTSSELTECKNEEKNEEELLAACIRMGMQHNRYRNNGSISTGITSENETNSNNVCEAEEENEKQLLAACIRTGMQYNRYRNNFPNTVGRKCENNKSNCEADEENEEELLAACINKGMQNNRYRQSKQANSTKHRSLTSALPKYQIKSPQRTGIPIKSESQSPKAQDSRFRMPENRLPPTEFILDTTRTYCTEDTPAVLSHSGSQSDLSVLSITSKAKIDVEPMEQTTRSNGFNLNMQQKLMKNTPYLGAKDEVEQYAVEDSPCHFSLRSSLSDLTVDGNTAALHRDNRRRGDYDSNNTSFGSGTKTSELINNTNGVDSLSSLSAESFNSTDEALLEKCIKSGMPKPKTRTSALPRPMQSHKPELHCLSEAAEQALLEQCILNGMPKRKDTKQNVDKMPVASTSSKNVYVASVVMSTTQVQHQGPETTRATDVDTAGLGTVHMADQNLYPQATKNGFENNSCVIDNCSALFLDESFDENSSEQSESERNKIAAQNRMLDPDAMIESLDRFTAELVSQSSHLNHNHDSRLEHPEAGDTWNDDTSPNDVSFPSISVSMPLAASFKSDSDYNENKLDAVEESNQFSSFNTVSSAMTDSTVIAMEAAKIVNVVQSDEMVQSVTSITSLELDQIKPPSVMESLVSITSSTSDYMNSPKCSPIPKRKKSIPVGFMVRRALGKSHVARSSENLADNQSNSSSYNLDHVKAPSVMGEYLDLVDMENSIISVSSITSEVAELPKVDFIPNGLVNCYNNQNTISNWMLDMKQSASTHLTCRAINCYSLTDIENINPPSLLNDITDFCTSTADVLTENVYSETEVFEDCLTHTMEQTLKSTDDITEYSDANSMTPIQSDFGSSAESTPKKVRNLSSLTPKQKRQLAKDRYKTYTVAAEMVCSSDSPNVEQTVSSTSQTKLTPKERRQLNRDRFQTRVLDGTIPPELISNTNPNIQEPMRKALRQKRREGRDRFRTRTLSSDEIPSPPLPTEDLQLLLEHEANIVLDTLNQSHHVNGDKLLDCETLSLVSNEDDSEHNSVSSINYRTYHKSWGFSKNLPLIQNEQESLKSKPKIVKPDSKSPDLGTNEEEVKGIRGRRKPLYSAPSRIQNSTSKLITRNVKPIKTVTSNLVKNVTSSLKMNSGKKINTTNSRPPTNQTKSAKPTLTKRTVSEPKTAKPPLERQGTFTKDEKRTKIPLPSTASSKIARAIVSKTIPKLQPTNKFTSYTRSPSADRNSVAKTRRTGLQNSMSSQSLQSSDANKSSSGLSSKQSSIPNMAERSNSNVSIASTKSNGKKKQVASKIASIWKRNDDSKKVVQEKGVNVKLRSKSANCNEVADNPKRLSRLGSFIQIEEKVLSA